jgi:hypothetical protein
MRWSKAFAVAADLIWKKPSSMAVSPLRKRGHQRGQSAEQGDQDHDGCSVVSLGKGTVEYVRVQAEEPPQLTMTMRMEEALALSDDRQTQNGEIL